MPTPIFRIFVSSTYEDLILYRKAAAEAINELDREMEANIAIVADLQGPKIRIGDVESGKIEVEEGDEISFVTYQCIGNKERLYLSYQTFPTDVESGDYILIDDGKIRLKVLETNRKDCVRAMVVNGGAISSKKGVNLPDTKISLPCLTEKDIKDAEFALEQNVDWIALSFVRTADDIKELKTLIENKGKNTSIIAKIEKPEALKNLDEIIAVSDAIMVARGDLGVEVSFDQVPYHQKDIVQRCIMQSKPVIIATQMMESMISNFRPTRAEANDVANAVMDGADALMLSGETSVGKYPVEAIKNMEQIIKYTEENAFKFYKKLSKNNTGREHTDELCNSVRNFANKTKAKAIICFTHSGYTAYRISSHRPKAPIFVFTCNERLLRRLNLFWGVRAIYYDFKSIKNSDEAFTETKKILKSLNHIKENDVIVFLASTPLLERGKTNMIKLDYV